MDNQFNNGGYQQNEYNQQQQYNYQQQPMYNTQQNMYGGQPPKKSKTGLIIGIIVAIILMLCCCCGLPMGLGILGSDDDSVSQDTKRDDIEKVEINKNKDSKTSKTDDSKTDDGKIYDTETDKKQDLAEGNLNALKAGLDVQVSALNLHFNYEGDSKPSLIGTAVITNNTKENLKFSDIIYHLGAFQFKATLVPGTIDSDGKINYGDDYTYYNGKTDAVLIIDFNDYVGALMLDPDTFKSDKFYIEIGDIYNADTYETAKLDTDTLILGNYYDASELDDVKTLHDELSRNATMLADTSDYAVWMMYEADESFIDADTSKMFGAIIYVENKNDDNHVYVDVAETDLGLDTYLYADIDRSGFATNAYITDSSKVLEAGINTGDLVNTTVDVTVYAPNDMSEQSHIGKVEVN